MANIWKTIKEPKFETRHNLKGLTELEIKEIPYDEENQVFEDLVIVGVEGTDHRNYVFVKKENFQTEFCSRHHTPMTRKTVMKTGGYFKQTTLFYQCDVQFGPDYPSGKRNLCHANFYPIYPSQQFIRESLNSNPDAHPFVFECD